MYQLNVVMLVVVRKEKKKKQQNTFNLSYSFVDHASWLKYGFPSAFAIESTFEDSNQNIHSENDVIEGLSFNHMKEFSKLALGFAVELSHKRN